MEVKNMNPQTPYNPDNQSEPTSDKLQTNRHQYVLLLSYLHSPYLCAYLCRLFACLYSRISTQRPLRTYTSHTLPPPI